MFEQWVVRRAPLAVLSKCLRVAHTAGSTFLEAIQRPSAWVTMGALGVVLIGVSVGWTRLLHTTH